MCTKGTFFLSFLQVIIFLCVCHLPNESSAQNISFRHHCGGNALESCLIYAQGDIDSGAAKRFQDFLESERPEGFSMLLDSRGGNLGAAIELGKAVRRARLNTFIASKSEAIFEEATDKAVCLSACAYVFLGGRERAMAQGARLGFHQFSIPNSSAAFQTGAGNAFGLTYGQQVSSLLVGYIVEMGVDARLFVLATSANPTDMFFPTEDQLREYAVLTPSGFSHFVLEPYKNGVVAVSKRLDETHPYDAATVLTAFCRAGRPYFLVTAPNRRLGYRNISDTRVHYFKKGFGFRDGWSAGGQVREADGTSYITIEVNKAETLSVGEGHSITIGAYFSRAEGGFYGGTIEVNAMDRRMLASAFQHCIDG